MSTARNTEPTAKVTIVIPTLNRWEFMARTLDYYRDNGFRGHLIIGDSSKPEDFGKVRDAAERIGAAFKVTHVACPDMDTLATLRRINGMIDTPFAVYSGDDDCLVPEAAARCIEFLDRHANYVAAQGRGRTLVLSGRGGPRQVVRSEPYLTRGFEHDTAQMRLTWHLRDYSVTIFAIHRSEVWQRIWAPAEGVTDRAFAAELLPSCRSVVAGKLKLLNDYYLVRLSHPATYLLPTFLDWVSGANWGPSYRGFVAVLGRELALADGISSAEAEELVKTLFQIYLQADRRSVIYRLQRLRMNMVTQAIPATSALAERFLPGHRFSLVRLMSRAIGAPFLAIRAAVHAPARLLAGIERAGGAIQDRVRNGYVRARRGVEKSLSKGLKPNG